VDGMWWDIGPWGESGQPPQHHHEQELLHNERPEKGAPKADPDASADQPGVTERAPELAGDCNTTVRAVVIHHTSRPRSGRLCGGYNLPIGTDVRKSARSPG
jgi:hypothetical protein